MADAVISQGKSGNWYYRKWSSGKYECWMSYSSTISMTNAYGYAYYANVTYTFPVTFSTIWACYAHVQGSTGLRSACFKATTSKIEGFAFASTSLSGTYDMEIYAYGLV